MKINRTEFLGKLELVKAGLSPRELIEQSTCFVFQKGHLMTFNDEIACRMPVGGKLHGAVPANLLMQILNKLPDDELTVELADKEIVFKGKSKRFGILRDEEIFLRIDQVETPKKWSTLSEEMVEAVKLVRHCTSTDESKFQLCCVHIAPGLIEACDNHQIMRVQVATGIKEAILIRGTSLAHIVDLQLDSYALTENWIHFHNESTQLTLSIRRYDDDYPDFKTLFSKKGHEVTLPKSIGDVCDRAEVFSINQPGGDPLVEVSLSNGRMRLEGRGGSGWYRELKKVKYEGPSILFTIAPKLLKYISEMGESFQVSEEHLRVTGAAGKWEYVASLGKVENA